MKYSIGNRKNCCYCLHQKIPNFLIFMLLLRRKDFFKRLGRRRTYTFIVRLFIDRLGLPQLADLPCSLTLERILMTNLYYIPFINELTDKYAKSRIKLSSMPAKSILGIIQEEIF